MAIASDVHTYRWRRPKLIFTLSGSDIEEVSFGWIKAQFK
jgi:hypothetical protein